MKQTIFIGYEPRETNAYLVACASIRRYWPDAPIQPLVLDRLRMSGLYEREILKRNGRMFDVISDAPMSTEFAISRFFTPLLAAGGLALFMDCDMLVRTDLRELFQLADPHKAVMCVQHEHEPQHQTKMDAQVQLRYKRKNWSSVALYQTNHVANRQLTLPLLNALPGRDLHAFCWVKDEDIGALSEEWNYLVGKSPDAIDPKIVHFTDGIPSMPGYEDCKYAAEWRDVLWSCLDEL